jgi:hypothetical protein
LEDIEKNWSIIKKNLCYILIKINHKMEHKKQKLTKENSLTETKHLHNSPYITYCSLFKRDTDFTIKLNKNIKSCETISFEKLPIIYYPFFKIHFKDAESKLLKSMYQEAKNVTLNSLEQFYLDGNAIIKKKCQGMEKDLFVELYLAEHKKSVYTESDIKNLCDRYNLNTIPAEFQFYLEKNDNAIRCDNERNIRVDELCQVLRVFGVNNFNMLLDTQLKSNEDFCCYLSNNKHYIKRGKHIFTSIARAFIAMYNIKMYVPYKYQCKKIIFQILSFKAFDKNRIVDLQSCFDVIKKCMLTEVIQNTYILTNFGVYISFYLSLGDIKNLHDISTDVFGTTNIFKKFGENYFKRMLNMDEKQVIKNILKDTNVDKQTWGRFLFERMCVDGIHKKYNLFCGAKTTIIDIKAAMQSKDSKTRMYYVVTHFISILDIQIYYSGISVNEKLESIYNYLRVDHVEFFKLWEEYKFLGSAGEFALAVSIKYFLESFPDTKRTNEEAYTYYFSQITHGIKMCSAQYVSYRDIWNIIMPPKNNLLLKFRLVEAFTYIKI